MDAVTFNAEIYLPAPADAPMIKGSAAWLMPARITVRAHWYPAYTHRASGKDYPARSAYGALVTGYKPGHQPDDAGRTEWSRGQWFGELVQKNSAGDFWVPEQPWLVVPALLMDRLVAFVDDLAWAVSR